MTVCRNNEAAAIETMLKYSAEWGVDSPQIAKAAHDWALHFWRPDVDLAAADTQLNRIAGNAAPSQSLSRSSSACASIRGQWRMRG